MAARRGAWGVLATAVCMGALVAPLTAAEAAAPERCGSVHVTVSGSRYGGPVEASRVSCGTARRVIRYALRHLGPTAPVGPGGWGCARGYPSSSYYAFTCEERKGAGRAYLVRVGARPRAKLVCGETHATVGGLRLGGPVRARGVSCRTARWVVHFALTHHSGNAPRGPGGWACVRGGSPRVSPFALTCDQRDGDGRVWLLNGVVEA